MNLQDAVETTLVKLDQRSPLAERFLETSTPSKRYSIGKNQDSLRVSQLVPLDGIIDDYAEGSATWHGMSVFRTSEIPSDSLIVNCSTSISPVSVLTHLAKSGLTHVVGLHELISASNGALSWPEFVVRQRIELLQHISVWENIFASLRDNESRQTILDVIRFRISCDPHYMKQYAVRFEDQYFEDFMNYSRELFVDAGGFDGDTSEAFALRYPDYRKIFVFEPSEKNMIAARHRLSKYEHIEFRQIGLSDSAGMLNFNQDAGSASSASDSCTTKIFVDTLDKAVSDKVTFIKMDLEGWELRALKGASKHIKFGRPKLAIAVYHDAADFRLIHSFVEEFGHNYDVYVRHYTQGWSETVMYFV